MRVVFRNLERSDMAADIVRERLTAAIDRFPELAASELTVTLSMHNSPTQPGPDLFSAKLVCKGGRYKNVVLEKSASHLYAALADLFEHLLERLKRYGDRHRVKQRRAACPAALSIQIF